MTTCSTEVCGTGNWSGPLPGDPDNNVVLGATPAFGGIDVAWSMPGVNPFAVAHTLVYRGEVSNFSQSIQIATTAGNYYFDKLDNNNRYYYWVRIVSINGTLGNVIGPASAVAEPMVGKLIEDLTGRIDAGVLAQSLRTKLDKIDLLDTSLDGETASRLNGQQALGSLLAQVQTELGQLNTVLQEEVTQRVESDSALITAVNSVAASASGTTALIFEEQAARATADSALAAQITLAQSSLGSNLAQAQTSLQTNINTVDDKVTNIGALYTAKVSVDGLVGGFGIYNDGTEVEAGFDVDRFWIGRTNSNKRKPFIIENGTTYIDEALIRNASIDNAKIGSLDAGKINTGVLSANVIQTGSLDSKISNIDWAKISNAYITNAQIGYAAITTAKIGNNEITFPSFAQGASITDINPGSTVTLATLTVPRSFATPGYILVEYMMSQVSSGNTMYFDQWAQGDTNVYVDGSAVAGFTSIYVASFNSVSLIQDALHYAYTSYSTITVTYTRTGGTAAATRIMNPSIFFIELKR